MSFLHVYTGNGKGKTTCAIGLAVRAAGAGKRVAFVQFDKGFDSTDEHYSERAALRQLSQIDLYTFGTERVLPDGKFRFDNETQDYEQARAALDRSRELVTAGEHFLVVCDEAVTCVATDLYSEKDLMELVNDFDRTRRCELVLTGRGGFRALIEAADLVTEFELVKHYFYSGRKARRGIDF